MADIEFVIEAPQATRTSKKRPRLVTSCDHCRVKKIKCVQQPATGKCEACLANNIPCHYRDREQYFAERTRMLSGASSALRDASKNAPSRPHLSAINALTPSTSRGPTPPSSSRSNSSTSTTPDRSTPPSFFSASMGGSLDVFSTPNSSELTQPALPTWDGLSDPLPWPSRRSPNEHASSSTTTSRPTPQQSLLSGLFDLHDSSQPHPTLMLDVIHLFFDNLGPSYPFLTFDNIYDRFLRGQLPALLANSIAASAVRFSTLPEIAQIGHANVTEVYCHIAKNLVPPNTKHATVDTLHAVMLLSWVEYKRGRQTMFNTYARLSARLAADLGISDVTLPQLLQMAEPQPARILQATWHGIQLLERTLLASELIAFSNTQLYSRPVQTPPHPSLSSQHYHGSAVAHDRSSASLW